MSAITRPVKITSVDHEALMGFRRVPSIPLSSRGLKSKMTTNIGTPNVQAITLNGEFNVMTRRNDILHHFKLRDAETYGVTEAIVLHNLRFWIEKNKAKGTNLHNGTTWTYNSYKKFSKVFPYLSESQIKRALASLVKQGAIVKGNFNKKRYDRTNWYALVDELQSPTAGRNCSDEAIHYNGRVESFERAMSSLSADDCVQPIPDTKTQILKHS